MGGIACVILAAAADGDVCESARGGGQWSGTGGCGRLAASREKSVREQLTSRHRRLVQVAAGFLVGSTAVALVLGAAQGCRREDGVDDIAGGGVACVD